jgi:oxygen-independent coproporphyrinogen-3 oxidase
MFWQAYTGSIPVHTNDRLLATRAARCGRRASSALRLTRRVDGELRLTPAGYDRYHDLERWVTYHLIEPLWTEMMEEHGAAPDPAPAGGAP